MIVSDLERILVRLPNWVGDVVMATPALAAIREACPRARVVAVGRGTSATLLTGSPLIDEVWGISKSDEQLYRGALSLIRRYRKSRFDAAILLAGSLTSALPVALARIPVRAGFPRGRRILVTHPATDQWNEAGERRPRPMPEVYQDVLNVLGIPAARPDYVLPALPEDEAACASLLGSFGYRPGHDRIVGINPGAKFGSTKLWSPERFGEVGRELLDRGFRVLLLLAPGEEAIGARVAAATGTGLWVPSSPIPLPTLRGVMGRLSLLITNDTGPRHMAVAAGCPIVTILGPTFAQWTDWNLKKTTVIQKEVPCGPCHLKVCPHAHECMSKVSAAEVLSATLERLGVSSGANQGPIL